jgi:CRISPR/Cas system-associated exonuclease Cas4 (RecB family)
MKRVLSYSEISTALDCQAKHDFAYVGHLAGDALVRREAHVRLREGRAWGRAVAALHLHNFTESDIQTRYSHALAELHKALDEDADQLREVGFYDQTAHHDLTLHLEDVLWHYAYTSEPLHVTHPELEIRLPIPSRTGARASSRYEFLAYIDGLTRNEWGLWIVEYKLRKRLTGSGYIALGRQFRLYAWAVERTLDEPVQGVIVDERLNEAPKEPRWVKGKKKGVPPTPSHAKEQLTTPERYAMACREAGIDTDPNTIEALGARKWQDRQYIVFTPQEIADVDLELRSAARLIQQLDSGVLHPLRNPSPMRCGGCAFRDICAHPRDHELVDALYQRIPPKHERQEIAA